MSRFLLALKVCLAKVGSAATIVFDEVDSGIGGATAAAVGERLKRLAKDVQVLVVAIDEARVLLEKTDKNGTSYFRLLRRALTQAHIDMNLKAKNKMIFAVLVDTNSQVHDFVPPLSRDSSSRSAGKVTRLFPPFVLTHTMDVKLHEGKVPRWVFYKTSVLEVDEDNVWKKLASMGRPLWYKYAESAIMNRDRALSLAASKLLCGLSPSDVKSYGATSLNGVAALLCRLGVRPHSSSALASQVVADFMAVLHYVNYTHEAHICGYVTEPVLTFAATHLWYELTPHPLQTFMLPQFQELLMQGMLDVGGIGEVVARIFLLLAMDATIRKSESDDAVFGLSYGTHCYRGQFCSVQQFLDLLDGTNKRANKTDNPKIFYVKPTDKDAAGKPTKAQTTRFTTWKRKWAHWEVGFSHFVELTAVPTFATLWFLLGRRAAGVLPRGHKGADLIIPIYCPATKKASFILVQVKNKGAADANFPQSALGMLSPDSVFTNDSREGELAAVKPRDMIRIFMSLRESSANKSAQSYLIEHSTPVHTESYSLVLRGMCHVAPSRAADELQKKVDDWPFLQSTKLAERLVDLADAGWWDPMEKVDADLLRRRKEPNKIAFELDMPEGELKEGVHCTLGLVPYNRAPSNA